MSPECGPGHTPPPGPSWRPAIDFLHRAIGFASRGRMRRHFALPDPSIRRQLDDQRRRVMNVSDGLDIQSYA
jgi:hypothetical protein